MLLEEYMPKCSCLSVPFATKFSLTLYQKQQARYVWLKVLLLKDKKDLLYKYGSYTGIRRCTHNHKWRWGWKFNLQ